MFSAANILSSGNIFLFGFFDDMLSLYPKRRPIYLCSVDRYKYVWGSSRVSPFGAESTFRKGIISASRVPDLLGLGYNSRYKTIYDLNAGQSSSTSPENSFEEAAKNHGHRYEKEAAFHFLDKTDLWPLGAVNEQFTHKITVVHEQTKKEFSVAATPDLLVFDPETDKISLLEIKCPYKLWCEDYEPKEEDDDTGLDILKLSYYIQCQFQMAVTSLDTCFVCIYFPPRGQRDYGCSRIFKISQDREFQRFLLMAVHQSLDDIESGDPKRWNLVKNERPHNTVAVVESMRSHVTVF